MKTKNLFTCLGVASRKTWACLAIASRRRVLPVLLASLNLIPAGRVTAQTFTTLHSFTARSGSSPGTNSDGANPEAGLILSGHTLYGTAREGGSAGRGTVFAVNTDGTGFTNLHSFTAAFWTPPATPINSDGINPYAGLILSGNTLYGTAQQGGSSGKGTVFAVNTDGTGFTTLYSFTATTLPYGGSNSDGVYPYGALTLSGNTLYGTALSGGSSGGGTVFALNTNGTAFTTLHNCYTHVLEESQPYAGLILSGNTLYGTALSGGSSGRGTVFAVNTNGTGFTNLYSFTATSFPDSTNSDGASPWSGLILSGNTLYGTAAAGGSSHHGTVFAVNTDGTGFTTVHNFSALLGSNPNSPNSDGADPVAGLILSGTTLYGTAVNGGSSGYGTVFAVNTNGTGFTTLYSFTSGSDGANPQAGLILSGNTFYGTTEGGGSSGNGTVFSLSFRPQLTITPSGPYLILSWPTNVAGFDYTGYTLQSATNLGSPATWSTNSPAPVVIAGQNTVTNPITGAQQFYRLVQ
jgi:uncharacterized repeat protein (TIGR03803 family)